MEVLMKEHIKRIYIPMTETAFYILLSLKHEMHGYSIVQKVKELTNDEVLISAGTMYGTLSKMEKDELIKQTKEEGKRKYYGLTTLGLQILEIELQRIARLYANSKGEKYYER